MFSGGNGANGLRTATVTLPRYTTLPIFSARSRGFAAMELRLKCLTCFTPKWARGTIRRIRNHGMSFTPWPRFRIAAKEKGGSAWPPPQSIV